MFLQDGERWMADDCTVCFCDSGKPKCYTQQCPACPAGTRSIAEAGECCGTCQKGMPYKFLTQINSLFYWLVGFNKYI